MKRRFAQWWIGALAIGALSGCYIQGGVGAYVVSHSEGSQALEENAKSNAIGFQISFGAELQFGDVGGYVGAGGSGFNAGSVEVVGGGFEFGGLYRLRSLGNDIFADGAVTLFGTSTMTGTLMDGSELEAKEGSQLDLFGGLTYSPRATNEAGFEAKLGVAVIRRSTDALGSVNAIGPELRVRYVWYPSFAPSTGGGGGSGGQGFTTHTKGDKVYAVGHVGGSVLSDATQMLERGARNMGCTNIVTASGGFAATCMNEPVVFVVTDNKVAAQCSLSAGEDKCKVILVLAIKGM